MKLDKYTYGCTPAAMHLTQYINEQGSPSLNRKVGRVLSSWRSTINAVVSCHSTDPAVLSRADFARLLHLLDAGVRAAAEALPDALCRNLVTNVLVGELKSWKTRTAGAAAEHRKVQRATPSGTTVPSVTVKPLDGEESQEARVERLIERSRRYLARKGKRNTLY